MPQSRSDRPAHTPSGRCLPAMGGVIEALKALPALAALPVLAVPPVLMALLLGAGPASASRPSPRDCREAGEFIANAAHSRDNGMSRARFVARLEEDLIAIRAFPPALRWFAQDADDERLLREEVAKVFDAPQQPAAHRRAFEQRCALHGLDPADG